MQQLSNQLQLKSLEALLRQPRMRDKALVVLIHVLHDLRNQDPTWRIMGHSNYFYLGL